MQSTFPFLPFVVGLAAATVYLMAGMLVLLALTSSVRHERALDAIVGDTFLRAMACWLLWPLVAAAVLIWSAQRRRRDGIAGTTGRL
ncbi:hypothetical protein H0Z60_10080 [Ectothiorhodospiraceae bacterium WFHF3C12]|nr:hypothetical protein [Ectothiorhodospiraceae bacterium WFHF3C12]